MSRISFHSPNSKFRTYIAFLLLIICLIILSQQVSQLSNFIDFDVDDFVQYWSASILHINQHNPYDRDLLTSLQNQAGRFRDAPVIMWNPPWTLALVLPFGLLNFSLARILWFFTHLSILLICSAWLWNYYGGSKRQIWLAWLLSLTFGPALIMLKVGQISSLFLLGVVGYLFFEKKKMDFFAGASAALLMIKPHIGLLFIVTLVVWAVHKQKWKILFGSVSALAIATIIVTVINPPTLYYYAYAAINYPPVDWATPTIGGLLRYILGVELFWIQFIPPMFGVMWAVYYYYKHHINWKWGDQLTFICLVSVSTAAYGWVYDQVLILCAIIQVALWMATAKKSIVTIIVFLLYAGLNVLVILLNLSQFWYFWFAPSLLLVYLVARNIIKPDTMVVNDLFTKAQL